MYSDNKTLRKKQESLLVLMKKFHDLCVGNHIQYSVHGGTMLGAVREHGFIPWDDDVDVTLMREEYEKLKIILGTKPYPDCLEFDTSSQQYPIIWYKVDGLRVSNMDVFIYDYISENKITRIFKMALEKFFIVFVRDKETLVLTKKAGKHTGIQYVLMFMIIYFGSLFPKTWRIGLANKVYRSFGGLKKFVSRSNDTVEGIRIILRADILESVQEMSFENIKVLVSKKYHEILVSSYGEDYMIPKKTKVDIVGD